MKKVICLLFLVLAGCSGGGGGSPTSGGGSSEAALSSSQSTITTETVFLKEQVEFKVIVTPRDSNGNPYDITNKYDIIVSVMPSVGTLKNFSGSDFTKVGDTWVASYSPDATASANISMMFSGGNYNRTSVGDLSTVKISVVAWNECHDPSPDGPNTTQIFRKKGVYNLICDAADMERLAYNNGTVTDMSIVNGLYQPTDINNLTANRKTALLTARSEDFVLMVDLSSFSSKLFNLVDYFSAPYFNQNFSGNLYLNGKGTSAVVTGVGTAYELNNSQLRTGTPVGF